jgi:hypothetical protein
MNNRNASRYWFEVGAPVLTVGMSGAMPMVAGTDGGGSHGSGRRSDADAMANARYYHPKRTG